MLVLIFHVGIKIVIKYISCFYMYRKAKKHKNETNSLLSSLRPGRLQAIIKFSSPPLKKNSSCCGIFPLSRVFFISSKAYSCFIFLIFFPFRSLSFTQQLFKMSSAFVDKTFNNGSASSSFGGSGISLSTSSICHCYPSCFLYSSRAFSAMISPNDVIAVVVFGKLGN